MMRDLFCSPLVYDSLKELPTKNIPFFGTTIECKVSSIFPYEETVSASDVKTREEIIIKTGRVIEGVILNYDGADNILRITRNLEPIVEEQESIISKMLDLEYQLNKKNYENKIQRLG